MSEQLKLITKEEYKTFEPKQQGYVVYMQADLPGSELKGLTNPYLEGSSEWTEWNQGEFLGVQAAMDSEE